MKSPSVMAELWAKNLQGAVEKIKAGVAATKKNPMEAAIEAKDRYESGIRDALASGRYEAGLRRASFQKWKDRMSTKGVNRLADGVRASMPAVVQYFTEAAPIYEQAQAAVAGIKKDGSEAAALERVRVNMQIMKQLKGRRTR